MAFAPWLFYGMAILAAWWQNRWIVCRVRPTALRRTRQGRVWLARMIFTCGTIAWIWFQHEWFVALAACGCYYVFAELTLWFYRNREIYSTYRVYMDMAERRAAENNQHVDDASRQLYREMAEDRVIRNIKGEA